jgi:hypothetical protein
MKNIEKVFDGVTLMITPECVYGTVTQEEASKAIKRHAVKSIHEGNFAEAELCSLFDLAIKLRYKQVQEEPEEDEIVGSEKEIIMRVVEKAIDQDLFDEVICFAMEDDSDSWVVSLLHAEKALLK